MHVHDVERLPAAQGYLLDRVRGSHRHYRRQVTGRRLTLTCHSLVYVGWRWPTTA
jgi:predicted RNA binding protein YcfA (HicA-like mRNA interferase family)